MNLREQAAADFESFLADTSAGFGELATVTSPTGTVYSVSGYTADIADLIDPQTGETITGRNASLVVPLSSFGGTIPTAIKSRSSKPWRVQMADSQGEPHLFSVIDVKPDRTIGAIVLVLQGFDASA